MIRVPMRRFDTVRLVLLMSLVCCAIPTLAQECPELVGRVPYGPARAVASAGALVYYSSGSMLMIADVSNPENPVVVGELQAPSLIQDVEIVGSIAHVACGYAGYWMADVSVPSMPVALGSFITGPISGWAFAMSVAASGDLVFVADGSPGLTILDVGDPESIQWVSEVTVLNSYYLEVRGSHVFLSGYDGLNIVDVDDPANPVIVGNIQNEGYGIALDGDYAYVAGGGVGVRVYDVSEPDAPYPVTVTGPPANDLVAGGGFLHVTSGDWFHTLDLVDPGSPSLAGEVELSGVRMAVTGDHTFVAGHSDGLQIVDLSDPAAPVVIAALDTPGWTLSVAASESLIFVDGGNNEVHVFDVTNHRQPRQISIVESDGSIRDLGVAGDVLFVASSASLGWIDVSDPSVPVVLGSIENGANVVEILGDRIFIVASNQLKIFDISTPEAPAFLGQVTLPDSVGAVAVDSTHAFVTVDGDGLRIIDVTDPTQPSLIGDYGIGERFGDVEVSEGLLFVTERTGLRILDNTTAGSPVELSRFNPAEGAGAVAVSGSHVYIGGWDTTMIDVVAPSVTVLDVSDPSNPVPAGSVEPGRAPGWPPQIKVVGDLVYVAHYIGGTSILRGCHALLIDGFESGNTSAWSAVDPN